MTKPFVSRRVVGHNRPGPSQLRRLFFVLVAVVPVAFSPLAGAQAPRVGKVFDDHTALDVTTYPPDNPVDFQHLRLELTFDDLTSRSFDGVASLTVAPVRERVSTLKLDAIDLEIKEVRTTPETGVHYEYDGGKLVLQFAKPLAQGKPTTITIVYRCREPIDGMIWAIPDEAYRNRPLVIHTQGEAEYARYWFPCLDSPVDRCTSEMIVTVPKPFLAISNGKLAEKRDDAAAKRTTYRYVQEQPHAFYLVSLVIGEHAEVRDTWRGIDVQYFVPKGMEENAKLTYGRTPEMMTFFSERLGYDYPYAKYSQTLVPTFYFGGMENTSATTMTDTALLSPRAAIDQDLEGLISHELAHQWFGDLLTCRGWKHIWLNEGFASFMDEVWEEKSKGRDKYLYDFWETFERVAANDRSTEGPPLLFAEYRVPEEVFRFKGSMPYAKGSSILHMLRHDLGEELFWRGMAAYVRRFAYQPVETNDFRRVMEEVSGQNLEQFFTQWTLRSGVPHLELRYAWEPEEKTAVVTITQTQAITRDAPAFHAPLDLLFRVDGKEIRERVVLNERKEVLRKPLSGKPEMFCVDPEAGLLMKLDCEKPRELWLAELRDGPTAVSRSAAARALAKFDRADVIAALREKVADAKDHWLIRAEAAQALGKMNALGARDALMGLLRDAAAIAEPRVRAAVLGAAGAYDAPAVGEAIAPFAREDASSRVEAAATAALGRISSFNAESILVANAEKESYENQIRTAAIQALAQRNDPRAAEVALRYAAYGQHDKVRPAAIRALGRLARENPPRRRELRDALIRLLSDPQRRSVRAAVEALADIGDAESVEAIRRATEGAVRPSDRDAIEDAIARAKGETDSETVRTLRESVRELREQVLKFRDEAKGLRPERDEKP